VAGATASITSGTSTTSRLAICVIPSRQWGVGVGSGARVEIELTTLLELRDGQITRVHQYDTLEEAREAAGRRG
jgi:hypothetical protein